MNMMDSLWADTALPTFPPLEQDTQTDVLIIGGGLAGILCAYTLTQAGADCLLIEADTICGGVTRNTTAKITSQHGLLYGKLERQFGPEAARLYWKANEAALRRYRQLAKAFPCNFAEKPSYVYALDRPEALQAELAALERLGIPAAFADHVPLPFPTAGAIRFEGQGQFHPLKLAAGVARDLPIREHTAARAFEKNTVVTDHGRVRAKHIIVATHFPLLNKHGGYFLKLYQHRSYVLALEGAMDVRGMYLDAAENGISLRNYGPWLLLGGGGHRTGKPGGGWAALEDFARKYFPNARETCRWATQDCMTLDGVPYIGQYGRHTPGLYVATGFNKWGMTGSMVAAMVLSDLVQGKQNPYAAVFSPARTMLRPQLLANLTEATASLLTVSKPRCPHMGCALKWNPRERTWDCPCHGSRFTEEGELLDNPATGGLKGE